MQQQNEKHMGDYKGKTKKENGIQSIMVEGIRTKWQNLRFSRR
jgi:hypothetical protein